jgi:hypothetical protein
MASRGELGKARSWQRVFDLAGGYVSARPLRRFRAVPCRGSWDFVEPEPSSPARSGIRGDQEIQ